MPNEERPARVWIEPRVILLAQNPDALSMELVVFRNGPGTVNGEPALPFTHVPPGYRLIGPAEVAVLEACAGATVERLSNGWRMLDGESNRAVAKAELARRKAGG